jgi:hypothetical protein
MIPRSTNAPSRSAFVAPLRAAFHYELPHADTRGQERRRASVPHSKRIGTPRGPLLHSG